MTFTYGQPEDLEMGSYHESPEKTKIWNPIGFTVFQIPSNPTNPHSDVFTTHRGNTQSTNTLKNPNNPT